MNPQEINKNIDPVLAQAITDNACWQIQTSRNFKRQRMSEIAENENLYSGIIQKSIRNPFNECFPFMSGYVDYLRAKIDDDSTLLFTYTAENDLKKAQKVNSFYDLESKSLDADALWDLKHRHAKFNAIFSGVAIYSYYSEKTPKYKSCLGVVSHYDFHCEPRGGAILEKHLFCGEDNIFKNVEDIRGNDYYNQAQVEKVILACGNNEYKDNSDQDNIRNNRLESMKQDAVSNNFVGQNTIKFAQLQTTYKGKRYYVLFNEISRVWIRVCPLEDIVPSGLFTYVAWHTNEDPDVFWSKAPADDARPIARIINTMINQELYNRQKRNYGQRAYDVEMFPNVKTLADWRPDGLVPVDTKGGSRPISSGMFEFKTGDLNGTLDLVTWLDQFTGKQIGHTASSAGQSESDKKVGVFQGEIEQIDKLINVKNKSFKLALSQLGLRFKQGLDANLSEKRAISIMGPKGIEWTEIGPEDLITDRDLSIQPVGGTSEFALKQLKDNKKAAILAVTESVNPQWKDRQNLLLAGFTEEETKDAFSADTFAQKELMSEAAQAEKDILQGKSPLLNRGADSNFIEHIVNFATNSFPEATPEQVASMSESQRVSFDKDTITYQTLMDYAMAHEDIAVENETRNIKGMIREKKLQMFSQATPDNSSTPVKEHTLYAPPVDNLPIQ